MKRLLNLFALVAVLFSLTGCRGDVWLNDVEPSDWQKRNFEKSVTAAVRKAVAKPDLDNGSTIVVTVDGDTLVAPADSVASANPARVVYVDIQAPAYPHAISDKVLEIGSIVTITSIVGVLILLVIVLVVVVVMRRQAGRNKLVREAIEAGYQLPEAFFTGAATAGNVTVNQVIERKAQPEAAGDVAAGSDQKAINEGIKDAVREASGQTGALSVKGKTLRNSVILVGLGIVLFISLAGAGAAPFGFFVGGTLVVLGVANVLSSYLSRKL